MKQQPKRNERSRPSAQHAMELHQDNPSQEKRRFAQVDRKSTRLNSSHGYNSYAALCLQQKGALTLELSGLRPHTRCAHALHRPEGSYQPRACREITDGKRRLQRRYAVNGLAYACRTTL